MVSRYDFLTKLGIPSFPSSNTSALETLFWAREVLQQHSATTYKVNDSKGIDELKALKIGGIEQWLHIRGRNRNNPILLYLHGGPGWPMIGWMDAIQRPWEDYCTVVHWDQRQTGKSYYSENDAHEPLTIRQFIDDTEAVIQYLLKYLQQDKLFLLGHSWGSILGMHVVERHPDWLHAYIGVGQAVNLMDNERVLYERLLSHAREQGNSSLVEKMMSFGPYPDPSEPELSFATYGGFLRRELSLLAGETMMHHLSFDDVTKMINFEKLVSPHLTLIDLSNGILGEDIALFRPPYTLTKEFMTVDLPNVLGSSFKVPIFFFTGTHDWHTPRVLSDKWFHQIDAPYKALIHFKESSHLVVNEEPGKVLISLVSKVLPCAQRKKLER